MYINRKGQNIVLDVIKVNLWPQTVMVRMKPHFIDLSGSEELNILTELIFILTIVLFLNEWLNLTNININTASVKPVRMKV